MATTDRGRINSHSQKTEPRATSVSTSYRWAPPEKIGPGLESLSHIVGKLFKDCYTPEDALPWFAIDGRTGHPLGQKTLLPELGDYLPFLAAIGETEYVQQQGHIVNFILKGGIEPVNPDRGRLRWLKRQNPFYFSDLILGLLECHALGLGEHWLKLAQNQMDRVLTAFLKGDGLCKERLLLSGWRLPVCESNSIIMVEILIELYRRCDNPTYLKTARQLIEPWRRLAKERGAVPQVRLLRPWIGLIPGFANRTGTYPLYKHNLFFLHALASIAEVLDDEGLRRDLGDATFSILRFFRGESDMPCYRIVEAANGFQRSTPTLKCTLLAEHLCDLAQTDHRPELIREAAAIVEFWLGQRHPRTGLIPYRLGESATDVDSLTDFAVTLIKLSAACQRKELQSAAIEMLIGMLEYHFGPYGLYNSVDVCNGVVLNSVVETRYVSLFLKPWLLLNCAENVYRQPGLLALVRDR